MDLEQDSKVLFVCPINIPIVLYKKKFEIRAVIVR